jgi:hypothetical protein
VEDPQALRDGVDVRRLPVPARLPHEEEPAGETKDRVASHPEADTGDPGSRPASSAREPPAGHSLKRIARLRTASKAAPSSTVSPAK